LEEVNRDNEEMPQEEKDAFSQEEIEKWDLEQQQADEEADEDPDADPDRPNLENMMEEHK